MASISESEVRERVASLTDEDDFIYGLALAGESDTAWYVLVVMERRHEGETYLNERYALLAKPGAEIDDTYMKNGINRRVTDTTGVLARALGKLYMGVSNFESALAKHEATPDEFEANYVDATGPDRV